MRCWSLERFTYVQRHENYVTRSLESLEMILEIEAVNAYTLVNNTRSQHVLEKVGFRYLRENEGYRYYRLERDTWKIDEEVHDYLKSNIEVVKELYKRCEDMDIVETRGFDGKDGRWDRLSLLLEWFCITEKAKWSSWTGIF